MASYAKYQFWHLKVGSFFLIAGIGIVSKPGFSAVIVTLINKRFSLGLPMSQSPILGWILIFLGFVTIIIGESARRQTLPQRHFLVLRHKGLPGVLKTLQSQELPNAYQNYAVKTIESDQSGLVTASSHALQSAIIAHRSRLEAFDASRETFPESPLGYYGIAHIPFLFFSGCHLGTTSHVHFFEQSRKNGEWKHLQQSNSPVHVVVEDVSRPSPARLAVITIAISYEVHPSDVAAIFNEQYEHFRISIASPRIDAIASATHIDEICRRFRLVLDEIASRRQIVEIEVFYAGPAPLAVALGQQVSATIHPATRVYNYTRDTQPVYNWSFVINRKNPQIKVFQEAHIV